MADIPSQDVPGQKGHISLGLTVAVVWSMADIPGCPRMSYWSMGHKRNGRTVYGNPRPTWVMCVHTYVCIYVVYVHSSSHFVTINSKTYYIACT